MVHPRSRSKASQKSFADFYLSEETLRAISEVGYDAPTPVQSQAIPLIIAGLDLTVMSQTGTGKTAAFAIPTVEILDPTPGQIDVLILTPTRELAIQVGDEFEKLGKFKNIKVAAIYGGASYDKQIKAIAESCIIAATPGRLVDLLQSGRCDLSTLKHLIVDEADEMLSMGFAEDIDKILDVLPEDRQSLLFSATITNEVKSLSKRLLFYPEFITMSDESIGAKDVSHIWYPVRGVGRTRELLRIIDYEDPEQAIVFANTKNDTQKITDILLKHGVSAKVINGDLPQKERERTLQDLRSGQFRILVATDVAARGIDISGITHVFNYVVPDNAEVYIHRTGRTGRAGAKGKAISLISPAEFPTLHNVKKHYHVTPEYRELPTTEQILEAKRHRSLRSLESKLTTTILAPYGSKLGLAKHLISAASDDPAIIRMVARLLTLEDSNQTLPAPAAQPLSSPPLDASPLCVNQSPRLEPQTTTSDPPTKHHHPTPQTKPSPSKHPIEHPPASRTRSRLASTEDSTPQKQENQDQTLDPLDKQGRRRRRRNRSGRREERPVSTTKQPKSQSPHPPQTERQEPPKEVSHDHETISKLLEYSGFRVDASSFKKLWFNLGSAKVASEADLLDILVNLSGFDPDDFGSINMEANYSFVEVRDTYADDVIHAMNEQKWKGDFIAVEIARH